MPRLTLYFAIFLFALAWTWSPDNWSGARALASSKLPPLSDSANQLPPLSRLEWSPAQLYEYDPRNALRIKYAQACAADIGVIPEFDCTTGVEIPVFKPRLGLPLKADYFGTDCYSPAMLDGIATPCMPGSWLKLVPTGKRNVSVVALCRKYQPTSSSSPYAHMEPWQFNDIGIIAHNRTNGATCFFQSWTRKGAWDGRKVPSPMANSPAAKEFYVPPPLPKPGEPQTYTAGTYDCLSCHDADPFVVSPFLQKQIEATGALDPTGLHDADRYGLYSKLADRKLVSASTGGPLGLNGSACTGCHRMGAGSLEALRKLRFSVDGKLNLHGFMPTGDTQTASAWAAQYQAAMESIGACLSKASQSGCVVAVPAGTIK